MVILDKLRAAQNKHPGEDINRNEDFYPTVLVVDDDKHNLVAMEELLEGIGAHCVYLESGPEVLRYVLHHRVDVILLDVQMPDMDGYEVAHLLNSRKKTADIPILFITAISKEINNIVKGYSSGCVDFLFKPVEPAILLSKLKVFLELARNKMALEQSIDELKAMKRSSDMIIEAAGNAIVSVSPGGTIKLANKAAREMFGQVGGTEKGYLAGFLSNPDMAGKIIEATSRNRQFEGKTVIDNDEGSGRIIQCVASPVVLENGKYSGAVLIGNDITESQAITMELQVQALHDDLTGLGNRRLFENRFQQAMKAYESSGTGFALLYLDLDKFKQVNDTFSHEAGDKILVHVSESLKRETREQDVVCRMGGDEFAVILNGTNGTDIATSVSERIIQGVCEKIEIAGQWVDVGASIGISLCPEHASNNEEMLKMADKAMYAAKQLGGNHFTMARESSF